MTSPTRGMRADEELLADVTEAIRWDGRIDGSGIQTEVENGTVTLKGSVPNHTSRMAAVEQARLIPGVAGIKDRLKVEIQGGVPGLDGASLAARANDILQWDSALADEDVRVTNRDGVIEMEGSVDAHWKIGRASRLVQGIRGVQEVVNNLAVVPTDDIADESLADRILQALRRNALVNEGRIEVKVDTGIVTLEGTVPSWMEANTAREVVSNTPGTLEIRNLLETDMEGAPA